MDPLAPGLVSDVGDRSDLPEDRRGSDEAAESVEEASVDDLLEAVRASLARFPGARREAVLLLGHVLGRSESWIRAHGEAPVGPERQVHFRRLIARRGAGEPFAYLVGAREFWGLEFAVDARVLVPRPETEHLVEIALRFDLPSGPRILDLGTGSGILAVALARELGGSAVGVDLELGAASVARANARRLLPSSGTSRHARARFLVGDLASAVRLDAFDLVVSNPPYLDRSSPEVEAAVRRWEPSAALWADDGGRAVIGRILDLRCRLRPGSPVLIEIGHDQGEWVRVAAEGRGWSGVAVERDLSGHPRVAVLRA